MTGILAILTFGTLGCGLFLVALSELAAARYSSGVTCLILAFCCFACAHIEHKDGVLR